MTTLPASRLIGWTCFNCPDEAHVSIFDLGEEGFRFQHGDNPEHSMTTTGALGVAADRGWTEYHAWRDQVHARSRA
jgi:hypothetical protein